MTLPLSLVSTSSEKWHSRSLLLLAFICIGVVFVVADYAVMYRMRDIGIASRTVVEDMLASVELVSRIGRDFGRERRLIDTHIFETDPAAMSRVEAEIADVQTDFANAASQYRPLATLPDELRTWQSLEARVNAIQQPVTELLALSRQNEDIKAQRGLDILEPQFEEIQHQVERLIAINREGAEREVESVMHLQSSMMALQTILSLMGIAVTIMVGWWAIRLIGQREEQVARKSAMLEQQNRDLDAFAGRVAHDLRNPLSSVNLAASRLANQIPSGDQATAILRRAVERMDALIHDLLILSRAGMQPVEVCDPAKAAADVWDDLSPRVEAQGGTMRMNVVPAKVRASGGLLRQALSNLVDNAVKYRRPDVAVHVDLTGRSDRQTYEIHVSDNGIGITQDEASKVFDPFYRANRSRETGTGLGLSIVKRVIEASGGTISIHSQLGHGTTFIIHLPLAEERQYKAAG